MRARRILPVLYLVMTSTFILASFVWSPYDLKNMSQSLVSTVLFSNNILLIKEGSDYFDALNSVIDINPLIHTWSLAVEERFYLIFPLILLALHYLKVRRYVIVFSVLVFVIFSYSLESYSGNEKYVFYATHYRAWQLMFGAICVVLLLKNHRLLT